MSLIAPGHELDLCIFCGSLILQRCSHIQVQRLTVLLLLALHKHQLVRLWRRCICDSPSSPFKFALHGVPTKLLDIIPLARRHTAPVLDMAWSPVNDTLVASASEDGTCLLWKVPGGLFNGWTADGWEPCDLEHIARVDVSPRKVGQVLWHPTAANVLATVSGEHLVKLWDLADPARPRSVLNGHSDTIQSLDFNMTGSVLIMTCRDRKIQLFDARTGDVVRTTNGHGGIKGARVTWMGDTGRIVMTRFSKMTDRQVGIWEMVDLGASRHSHLIRVQEL